MWDSENTSTPTKFHGEVKEIQKALMFIVILSKYLPAVRFGLIEELIFVTDVHFYHHYAVDKFDTLKINFCKI